MTSTARPNRINVDLQHYKQPWIDYCSAHGTTPSEAFRMVVAKLTGGLVASHPDEGSAERGKVRREIRLTYAELQAVEALAEQEGFALSRWIVALVRARLGCGAQLGQQELELLARSNMQLLAIGRNLNQVARAVRANPGGRPECRPELIQSVNDLIHEHADKVAKVLASNVQRWSVK
jgi:hypothetical protein